MSSANPAAGSVSRVPVIIEIEGKSDSRCELIRHQAPLTITTILKNLPQQDRIHTFEGKFVYLTTNLTIGAEKQKSQFKRGDIGFMVGGSAVCVFIKDATVAPMNQIGKVLENIEIFESVKPGDIMRLKKE